MPSVRHLNLKSIALLTSLAVLVALAGCGGGSGDSTATGGETTAPVGKSESTVKSPTPERKAAKKKQQKQPQPAKLSDKQVEKKIHELANSGKPIPADSPVAKQIVAALTDNGSSKNKKGKKGTASIVEKLEEVVSPSQNGGGDSGAAGQENAPSAGVEKILEQIQK